MVPPCRCLSRITFRLSLFLYISLHVEELLLSTQGITSGPLNPITSEALAQPDQTPRKEEDDENSSQDSKTVARDDAALLAAFGVEEAVGVETLGVVGDVCDTEIEQQN